MKLFKTQSGASLLTWLFIIGIAGFAGVIGLRLIPIYLESYTVDTILDEVKLEYGTKKVTKKQLWSSISKRFSINNIREITEKNFIFKRERKKIIFTIKYEVRTKIVGNLDGIASFEKTRSMESDE